MPPLPTRASYSALGWPSSKRDLNRLFSALTNLAEIIKELITWSAQIGKEPISNCRFFRKFVHHLLRRAIGDFNDLVYLRFGNDEGWSET